MRLVTLMTFQNKEKAEAIKERLVKAGIPARRCDESNMQRFWFLSKPLAAHKVRVDEMDYERALTYLKELDLKEGILDDAVRCPHCGSSQIEYPQTTRKFFVPTLIELVIATGLVPKEYYCENCHFTWPAKFEAPPETWGGDEVDALGWKRKRAAH